MKNSHHSHRLLILTQKVDINDDILGFFHGWIAEFAKHCEKVIAVCLQKGQYHLPANVRVLSLGKEKFIRYSRHSYVIRILASLLRRLVSLYRFYKYIWRERKNYNAVFVHMNPIYVVLGGLFWRIWKKKIFLWYIHKSITWELKIAEKLVNKIFTAAEGSFPLKSKKLVIVGHGIDAEIFKRKPEIQKISNSILYVGRIAPIKNIDVLIEAIRLLYKDGVDFVLNIVGEAREKDKEYFKKIKEMAKDLEEKGKIKFLGKVPNYKMPEIYNQHEVLVNLTPSGSFDKAILEAMACGSLVLVSNKAFSNILPKEFIFEGKNARDLAEKIINIFNLSEQEKENYGRQFRQYILREHNLEILIEKIGNFYEKNN